MDVLQHPDAVVRGLTPTSVRMRLFQVAGRSSTLRSLRISASSSSKRRKTQVVGDLVGLDADQRRLDQIGRAHELIDGDVAELRRERRLELAQVTLPERARATDHVLPEARLRFVQSERRYGAAAEGAFDGAREACS